MNSKINSNSITSNNYITFCNSYILLRAFSIFVDKIVEKKVNDAKKRCNKCCSQTHTSHLTTTA